ncbi:unnamed protein product [Caenorhabditis bovis]|uniref:Galectin n=1 Tax=Caenorhabditis bovis TaxID=2654633 RepID=A0A8S1F523_9PELO|nr:unnamed protein product [Caenorhabditis bovis]
MFLLLICLFETANSLKLPGCNVPVVSCDCITFDDKLQTDYKNGEDYDFVRMMEFEDSIELNGVLLRKLGPMSGEFVMRFVARPGRLAIYKNERTFEDFEIPFKSWKISRIQIKGMKSTRYLKQFLPGCNVPVVSCDCITFDDKLQTDYKNGEDYDFVRMMEFEDSIEVSGTLLSSNKSRVNLIIFKNSSNYQLFNINLHSEGNIPFLSYINQYSLLSGVFLRKLGPMSGEFVMRFVARPGRLAIYKNERTFEDFEIPFKSWKISRIQIKGMKSTRYLKQNCNCRSIAQKSQDLKNCLNI